MKGAPTSLRNVSGSALLIIVATPLPGPELASTGHRREMHRHGIPNGAYCKIDRIVDPSINLQISRADDQQVTFHLCRVKRV